MATATAAALRKMTRKESLTSRAKANSVKARVRVSLEPGLKEEGGT
jgi:hypothetical protein